MKDAEFLESFRDAVRGVAPVLDADCKSRRSAHEVPRIQRFWRSLWILGALVTAAWGIILMDFRLLLAAFGKTLVTGAAVLILGAFITGFLIAWYVGFSVLWMTLALVLSITSPDPRRLLQVPEEPSIGFRVRTEQYLLSGRDQQKKQKDHEARQKPKQKRRTS